MSTKTHFSKAEINKENPALSQSKVTIETAFYGNNVERMIDLEKAYEMAKNSPGTIVTDLKVHKPEKIGIPGDARVLLFNDGEIVGRFAKARRILGEEDVSEAEINKVIREAVYNTRYKKMYHTEVYIGLDPDFMVKAHMLIPENHENIMYNWMLNFQAINEEYNKMYANSKEIGKNGMEPDIFIMSDPDYYHPLFPEGLAYFDPEHNCACLLGMRYFGEHKKETLTLAWGIANRNGYASCHGGLKRCIRKDGKKHVLGVFGLSGSGKSTITHAKHDGKYDVTVLHDDAYVISTHDGSTVALEPSYFDKTQDYPVELPDNKFLLTVQNCGATVDAEGNLLPVPEDIRNGNGRAIKSKLWAANRVDKLSDPINTIIWLMKDATLPPVLKIENPVIASSMGACLATKRTTAERLAKGVDPNALVFEPYANPFRTYPLSQDYNKFKAVFEKRGVANYIINTGFFMDKKIPKEVTISVIESIIDDTAKFEPFGELPDMYTMNVEGFIPDFDDEIYVEALRNGMKRRFDYISGLQSVKAGRDELPSEAAEVMVKIIESIK